MKMGYSKDFVKDFAKRTRKNLKFIETAKPEFKITQLVNSCLGLIAIPRQVCFKNIPVTLLEELASKGWPIPHDEGGFPPAPDLQKLIGHLRNGITHGHLKFTCDADNEIKFILVWDETPRGKKIWQARFHRDELRRFVMKFSDMLIDGRFCSRCCSCQVPSEIEYD